MDNKTTNPALELVNAAGLASAAAPAADVVLLGSNVTTTSSVRGTDVDTQGHRI